MVDPKTREFIRKTIRTYLPDPGYNVFLFGSHAAGYARPYSDIDVGIMGPSAVPSETMMRIKEAFEESMTAYVIDPVDFVRTSDSFREFALKFTQPLQ